MLDLLDVKKSFVQPDGTALPILDIPEFHVDAGEQMVLVGRSGCGKTTLLHVIAGISRPDSGKVRIDDWDITLFSEAECDRFRAERIGYVFQTFNLLRGFSALENVLVAMRFTGRRPDRVRARQLLARVGLDHRTTHRPAMLSVGEQQRVAVARCWPTSPSSSWPTSRRPTSTPATSSRSWTCCARPAGKRTWPWCWSPTAPRSPGSSIASRSWRSSTRWEKPRMEG